MNQQQIKEAATELDKVNRTLNRIIEDNEVIGRQDVSNPLKRAKATKLANLLENVRGHAEPLFKAVLDCCTSGCHTKHSVLLHLDNCSIRSEASRIKYRREISVIFKLRFSPEIHELTESTIWHETKIAARVPTARLSFHALPKYVTTKTFRRVRDFNILQPTQSRVISSFPDA